MQPNEIKEAVQSAYDAASRNSGVLVFRSSSSDRLFRDIKIYGRDAGVDFVETYIQYITTEAVEAAKTRDTKLDIAMYNSGQRALEGMADALRKMTLLKVEVSKSNIRLIWAGPTLGLL